MARNDWSDAEAERRFGWTARRPGHGHLYQIAVTVAGDPAPDTGLLVDLGFLDALLHSRVIERFADQDLNRALEPVARGDALPGCEVLAREIWRSLAEELPPGVELVRVIAREDDTLEAECIAP